MGIIFNLIMKRMANSGPPGPLPTFFLVEEVPREARNRYFRFLGLLNFFFIFPIFKIKKLRI